MKNTEISSLELEKQTNIIKQLNIYYSNLSKQLGKTFKVAIETFGCQMNVHDSEKLSGMMKDIGFIQTNDEDEADMIIYNTCCVRENAENKIYGKLGYLKHLKQRNENLKIILCGCMMQEDEVIKTIKQKYRHVDIIFGTFNLYKFPELLQTSLESDSIIIDIWKEHKEIVEDLPIIRENKYKASVNIMYGCNNFCTYCIVPYVRGRERSREVDDIVKEVKTLANNGVKEVTLLGQNVNSYGKTLKEPISFAKLLTIINEIDGIERIRFMTSHPKDLSDELIDAMKNCSKVCNHIHLPIQSGSTEILKKMNRKYTKEQYLNLVDKIKKAIPDIAITTDIIVGFPTETDEDVDETIDVVKKVRFNSAFTFIYSKRTGTPAARIEDNTPEEIIKKRFNKLLEVVNENIYIKTSEQVGKTYKVLIEQQSKTEENILSGRTTNNSLVHIKGDSDLIGKIVDVNIVDCKTFYLIGELKN